ncbi:hypothetical protein BTVI_75129 [Pitangus sulphuratus]|nr:hypothetical protein BTVI_75129 [Pitangus sulphuratus]
MGLRKQYRNGEERNGFAPLVYETLQAQKQPPPRQKLATGLGPAQAHPFLLLSCTKDGSGGDNTMWWQPKPPQAVCEQQGPSSNAPHHAALGTTLLSCHPEKPCPHGCPSAELQWDITRLHIPQHELVRGLGGPPDTFNTTIPTYSKKSSDHIPAYPESAGTTYSLGKVPL